MTAGWKKMPVSTLEPGARVRHQSGTELHVSRIEQGFMGRSGMVALIEDTPDRWMKAPVPSDGEIDVWAEA
jgi:hypothetical protein